MNRSLESAKEMFKYYRTYRNKKIAHRDKDTYLENNLQKLINLEDIEKINNTLELINEFMMSFEEAMGMNPILYSAIHYPNGAKVLINKLKELDDTDKNGKVKGTKESKIEGILDRTALLEMSSHTEIALNKTCDNNVNFVNAIRENKVILIEIPEQEFPSQMLRNIMATFYLSKIWLAKILLDKEDYQPTTELLFDEFYKCPNAQLLFEIIFAEARKYRLISTVAIHALGQLSSKCRMTLKAGGASYLLLSGADIQAYRELHVQFEKFGYDEQVFQNLNTYSALCLIKNEDENYSAFVAKIPA